MKHPVLKVIALFSAASAAFAQPASTTAKPAASSDEVIKLSEFNVSSARASGYRAQNAITALKSNYPDHPSIDKGGNFIAQRFPGDRGRSWKNLASLGFVDRSTPPHFDSREIYEKTN